MTDSRTPSGETPTSPRPTIEVAMCTYNGCRYLGEQLESIAGQRRRPDSLLVVDDGSTDDTVGLVREFARRAPFPVRIVVNENNLGYRRNFAKAVALSEAEIVALADQDDVWYADKLEALLGVLERDPSATLVFSNADVVDAELRPYGHTVWDSAGLVSRWRRLMEEGSAFEALLVRNFVTGATLAFRSEHRGLLLPFADGSDHDAWIALVLAAVGRVHAVPEPLMAYRQHGGNQIGGARMGALDRVRRSREQRQSTIAGFRQELVHLRTRLRGAPGVAAAKLEALDDAISLLCSRATLPQARARRVGPICRELVSGRYARRANGIVTALRDLMV